jgi:hypothetical protein
VPVLFEYAPPWAWALGSGALAAFYAVRWPRRQAAGLALGLRYVILRWFHSLVWVLIGVSLGLHAVPNPAVHDFARLLLIVALLTYVAFAAALLVPRRGA